MQDRYIFQQNFSETLLLQELDRLLQGLAELQFNSELHRFGVQARTRPGKRGEMGRSLLTITRYPDQCPGITAELGLGRDRQYLASLLRDLYGLNDRQFQFVKVRIRTFLERHRLKPARSR